MNQTEATGENEPRDKEHSDCSDASPDQEPSDAAPSDIVPEGFNIKELRKRQHESSSTPRTDQKRCPDCGSVAIHRKSGGIFAAPKRKDGKFRCNRCSHHFDEPAGSDTDRDVLMTDGGRDRDQLPPKRARPADARRREQTDVCPFCDHFKINYRVSDNRYRCEDCGETFDTPATRPAKRQGLSQAGRALEAADPDDLDLVTDGGRDQSMSDIDRLFGKVPKAVQGSTCWKSLSPHEHPAVPSGLNWPSRRRFATYIWRQERQRTTYRDVGSVSPILRDIRGDSHNNSAQTIWSRSPVCDNWSIDAAIDQPTDDIRTDGGYDVDGEPRGDEVTSLLEGLKNASENLQLSLERVDPTDEWTGNAIASILQDVRELRRIVESETDNLETDGGQNTDTVALPPDIGIEAERYDGDEICAYGCSEISEYRIAAEGERGAPFVACRSCLNTHNIYPEDNELVTDGGIDTRRTFGAREHGIQAEAGVGDQAPGGGCPHSDDGWPCLECLFRPDEDGDRQ